MNRTDGATRYEKFIKKNTAAILKRRSMFSADAIPPDARNVIDEFDKILQSVFPANGRQLASLPKHINALSHALTDERGERRRGYMNAPETLSAYVRYFSWWNIVRFTRLFANFEKDAFALSDGDACLDVGSGPLTAVISLWLTRSELRNKKLTWYCMDISQASLALGENLYLSIAARVPPSDKNAAPHWNIVRVKGALGEPLRQKASLIVCADMLNELRETDARSDEIRAKQYASSLLSYAAKKCGLLVIEPGVPSAARIISLMRDTLLKKNMTIVSPLSARGRMSDERIPRAHGKRVEVVQLRLFDGGRTPFAFEAFERRKASENESRRKLSLCPKRFRKRERKNVKRRRQRSFKVGESRISDPHRKRCHHSSRPRFGTLRVQSARIDARSSRIRHHPFFGRLRRRRQDRRFGTASERRKNRRRRHHRVRFSHENRFLSERPNIGLRQANKNV